MSDLWDVPEVKLDIPKIINAIENKVYAALKPLGFRKHGRTLHRFVDGDISQAIEFCCGQAYCYMTHILFVHVGIRVPECDHPLDSDEPQKKYYRFSECRLRANLGVANGEERKVYDLKGDVEPIADDITERLLQHVMPVFDVLSSREAILRERRNYPNFDEVYGHLILLDEAMIYRRMGNIKNATELFNQYYKQHLNKEEPNIFHIKFLEELAEKLGIVLEN